MHDRFQVVRSAATCLLFAFAASLASAEVEKPRSLSIGDRMPSADAGMLDVRGETVTLGAEAGTKGTLVVFTCNECPWAKAWEKRLVALGNTWSEKGFGVVAINSNDPQRVPGDGYEPMKKRATERGMEFRYVVDATSGVARAFGASRTPEVFLFDAEGRLAYHGAIDDNAQDPDGVKLAYLADALEAVAAGRTPKVAETKSLGCSIKFRAGS